MTAAGDRSKIRRAILLSLHYARDDGPVVFNGSAVGTWTHSDFNQAMAGLQELLAEIQRLRDDVLKWQAEYDGVIHRAAQLHEALEKIAQHDSSQWGRYAAEQLDALAAVVEE